MASSTSPRSASKIARCTCCHDKTLVELERFAEVRDRFVCQFLLKLGLGQVGKADRRQGGGQLPATCEFDRRFVETTLLGQLDSQIHVGMSETWINLDGPLEVGGRLVEPFLASAMAPKAL